MLVLITEFETTVAFNFKIFTVYCWKKCTCL
jgi:hypothetical protein